VSGLRLAVLAALSLAALGLPGSAGAAVPSPGEPTCSPGPLDCFEWHTAATITVTWANPPQGSGIVEDGCDPETIAADTDGTWVTCTWWAPDLSEYTTAAKKVRRDATPPSISAAPSRSPDHNGWYNRGLSIGFSGGDNLSGLAGCTQAKPYGGPDSGVASVTGTCTDNAGNTRSTAFTFQYDGTAPAASAKPDRQPDRKGWYNRKVTVDFDGSDGTSGIASCSPSVTYDGPNAGQAAVSGTCTDRAANTSAAASFELRFDSRSPTVARLKAKAGKKGIALAWLASEDASSFEVLRRPGIHGARYSTVYAGPKQSFVDGEVAEGVRYRYTVTASDDAGNEAVTGIRARALTDGSATVSSRSTARPALQRPLDGARLARPPLLEWTGAPQATYYNVQLFRGGKKILTAWPTRESLQLQRSWRFDGRTQRLSPGRYRWLVWPGFGKRVASDYGKLLGARTFVVTR
jgi:hypothetical protein